MIDGVNLITTETINLSGWATGNLILFVLAVGLSVAAFATAIFCIHIKDWGAVASFLIVTGLLALLAIISYNEAFNPRQEERYLVQLDDKISSEFIDKYDIVERKGNNVYVIKERNTND